MFGAKQHVVALVQHGLHRGSQQQLVHGIAGGIEDALLALHLGLGILLKGDHAGLLGGVEHQQVGQLGFQRAVTGIDGVFEAGAEVLEEVLIGLALVALHLDQLGADFLLQVALDGLQLAVLLQHFARDVQAQVLGVHHAAHEAEVVGDEVGALLHNHHVGTVERQALGKVVAVELGRRVLRDVEQRVVFKVALGVHADVAQRVVEVVEVALIELGVFLVLHLAGFAGPDGHHGVQLSALGHLLVFRHIVLAGVLGLGLGHRVRHVHHDGVAHIVAVAAHQVLERAAAGEAGVVDAVLRVGGGHVLAQVQGDGGAALGLLCRRNGVALHAVALPLEGLLRAIRTRDDGHLVGHHEAGVEAHAELADDVHLGRVLASRLGLLLLEFQAAGMGDGAQILLQRGLVHANAVVGNGDGAGLLVAGQFNAQLVAVDVGVGQAGHIQLVERVAGVGNQLAQENLAVGVNGIDHEVQQALGLRLEFTHGASPFVRVSGCDFKAQKEKATTSAALSLPF